MKDQQDHPRVSSSVLFVLALTLLAAGAATAQDTKTRKTEVFNFQVISVDGKPMSVHDLKAGTIDGCAGSSWA
jgi:uncharacterized membrane protein YsdA (DUF1294 family)